MHLISLVCESCEAVSFATVQDEAGTDEATEDGLGKPWMLGVRIPH